MRAFAVAEGRHDDGPAAQCQPGNGRVDDRGPAEERHPDPGLLGVAIGQDKDEVPPGQQGQQAAQHRQPFLVDKHIPPVARTQRVHQVEQRGRPHPIRHEGRAVAAYL